MKTTVILGFCSECVVDLSIAASAKMPTDVADGDKECSANHYHVADLVSYAEMREQRLALASMNYINRAKMDRTGYMAGTKAMCLSEHASKRQRRRSPMPVQLLRKFRSRTARIEPKGLQE
jgi:hypothetical protein